MLFTASRLSRALAFVAALATAPAVFAHAHLKNQYPAANAEVTAAPQALTLNFSEGIEPKFSGVTLTGRSSRASRQVPLNVTNRTKHK
jgi:methionine-rich copper-binding protein CopC